MNYHEVNKPIYRKLNATTAEEFTKYYNNYFTTTFNTITTARTVIPKIKDVIYNDPATIVFWEDGTKTVVKCKNEKFDPEKGLAMAF